jgi:Nif-specific regulatory protein
MEKQYENLQREVQELSLLFDVSQTLNRSKNIQELVGPVLKVMAEHMGMLRGTLTILNRKTKEIVIEDAYGLSAEEMARGRYKVGEGITGKVVETGEPMVVANISNDTLFLDRTQARKRDKERISFICVPIKIDNETIGTLSVDRPTATMSVSLDDDVRLLTIIASLIAQTVYVHQTSYEKQVLLEEENERLQIKLEDKFHPSNIIGNSNRMREVYHMIQVVSHSDTTVLILGESGVGKELVANAIHYNSGRAKNAFIKVNCAALPDNLIESELFGHEKGAFTNAFMTRIGRFESAHGGTLFLDEIGDLPVSTQIKLLRVLQEREFERLGSSKTIKTDVRLIAATNRDLIQHVKEGSFREDLYYRLNVFPICVPPLREKKTDIILLSDFFIEKYNQKLGRRVKRITTPAIDMLMSYHWPGNVRELENVIERAVLLSSDHVIHSYHLPPSLQTAEASNTIQNKMLACVLETVERDLIIDTLKETRGNMTIAAQILGVTNRIMGLRVKHYNLNPRLYK